MSESAADQDSSVATPAPSRGLGEVLAPKMHTTTDKTETKVTAKAVRQRWPISDKQRESVVKSMAELAKKSNDPRARANAGKVLVAMDALNQADEQGEKGVLGPTTAIQNNFYGSMTAEQQKRIDELARIGLAKLGEAEDEA